MAGCPASTWTRMLSLTLVRKPLLKGQSLSVSGNTKSGRQTSEKHNFEELLSS